MAPNITNSNVTIATTASFTSTERTASGLAMVIIGIIGLAGHIWSLNLLVRIKVERNAFIYLCLSGAISSIGLLLQLGIWDGIVTILDKESAISDYVEHKMGQLADWFYYVILYTHFAKAINRLVAIAKPLAYKVIFSVKNTKIFLTIVWALGTIHALPLFFTGCDFYYRTDGSMLWAFSNTTCGYILGFYIDFIYGVSLLASCLIIDMCTLYFLKKHFQFQVMTSSTVFEKRQKKRDIGFFIQTFITGILEMHMLVEFYFISPHVNPKWGVFLTTTMNWICFHALDGIIMAYFVNRWYKKTVSPISSGGNRISPISPIHGLSPPNTPPENKENKDFFPKY